MRRESFVFMILIFCSVVNSRAAHTSSPRGSRSNPDSFHQLELSRLPGLVEPRFQRAVEPENGIPALARNGLRPVRCLAGGGLGAEVEIHRAVVIHQQLVPLAAFARERLAGL